MIVNRVTLKGYFDTGDTITSATMTDLIDSGANLADTSAQAFQSEISMPTLVAARVSASVMNITGALDASAATISGRFRHGTNTGSSATTTLGDILVVQEATVTNTTAQVAFLPTTSNIISFGIKVLVGGSTATGGLNIYAGDSAGHDRFGKLTVSAVGMYEFVSVSAVRLTGVSGKVEMVASGASAGTNVVGYVKYFQRA